MTPETRPIAWSYVWMDPWINSRPGVMTDWSLVPFRSRPSNRPTARWRTSWPREWSSTESLRYPPHPHSHLWPVTLDLWSVGVWRTLLKNVFFFQVNQKFNTRWTTEEQLLAVQGRPRLRRSDQAGSGHRMLESLACSRAGPIIEFWSRFRF